MRQFLQITLLIVCFFVWPCNVYAQNKEADSLAMAVQQARISGDIIEAIRLNDEEIELRRHDPINSKLFLGNSIHNQAINYSAKNNYDEAIKLEEEAMSLFRKIDKKNVYIGACLNNLAAYYFSRGLHQDFAKAEEYAEEAIKYEKSGTEHYLNTLNQLVVYHSKAGHYDKANALSKSLFKQGKKIYGLNSAKYASILSNQSVKLAQFGDFTEAIKYAEESISIYAASTQPEDTLNQSFARLLCNTANYYANKDNRWACIEKLERANVIYEQIEGEYGTNRMNCIGELSSAYSHVGDLQKADSLSQIAEKIIKYNTEKTATLEEAQSLRKQAEVFANNGNFRMAINLLGGVMSIYNVYSDSLNIASTYNALSNYYYHDGKIDQAIDCCQIAVGLYTRNEGRKVDIAQAYNNMSIYSYEAKNYDTAIRYAKESVRLYKEDNDTISSYYAKSLANLALYNYVSNRLEEAISIGSQAYCIQSSILGEGHPDNVNTLTNLAQYYYSKGDEQKLHEYYHKALSLQSSLVKSNFSHMTTAAREMYWNTKKHIYSIAPTYAYLCENKDSLLLDAYNAQLFTKGILLNSEIDFKVFLAQSGDSILQKKYADYTDLNSRIADIYNNSAQDDQSKFLVKEMQEQAIALEREIMRGCKEYGDYTANMTISAEQIAASLQDGDVAVELFEIAVEGGKAYYAMYLKKGWTTPRMVKMFSHWDLNAIEYNGNNFYKLLACREGVDYLFSNKDVGQMVWNPLIQDWGEDVKNVYFSPSGLFYQWGIEYLQLGDNTRIGDKYNLYRLSSTKLLAQNIEKRPIESVSLYGGFDYDLPPTLMAEIHDGVGNYINEVMMQFSSDETDMAVRSIFDMDNTVIDSLAVRGEGGAVYLPGTLKEVDEISDLLMLHNVRVIKYTGADGIEESFKALSGKPSSLVHIATHGFSFDENNDYRTFMAKLLGVSLISSSNDANLNYSGLLFSGANNALSRKPIPAKIENGILTSREISMLDLRGLEMIVLSACQTGVGEIKEDGVFGLQRGFKKAGAKTLLMSLWSVDDRATQEMMTNFYSFLMQGVSRHEAFKLAQNKIREEGFSSPFYWASFIMLDDL